MTSLIPVVWHLVVVATVLLLSSVGFGWLFGRFALGQKTDTTVIVKRLAWFNAIQYLFLAVFLGIALFALVPNADDITSGLVITAAIGILGGVVHTGKVVPLICFDIPDRIGYGSMRDVVMWSWLSGFFFVGGLVFGIVSMRAISYAIIPLGMVAVLGYLSAGPWLMERLNTTEPLPESVADRCATLAEATDRHVQFRRLVDEDTPTAVAVGVWPIRQTIYVPDRLLADLDPAELDAVIGYELGHVHNGHLERRAGRYAVFVALLLLPFLTNSIAFVLCILAVGHLIRQSIAEVYEADAFAAAVTEPAAMEAALDTLATLGHLPRENSRWYDFLVEHPSVSRRIDRLAPQSG